MLKLSLIIPVYGVENYIHKFLSTLEKNLIPGIEVLLIDDGTKDNSGKIADEFALLHSEYVKVVHKSNGGASSARNLGLDIARGEYVIFPDSDDYLADNYVKVILDSIKKYDEPDMIFFDYYIDEFDKNKKLCTISNINEGTICREDFLQEFVKDKYIKSFLANKAIRKSFYAGISFNTRTRIAEDYEVLTDVALLLEKIIYIPIPLYHYVMRGTSLTHTMTLKDKLRYFELSMERYRKFLVFDREISLYGLVKAALLVLREVYLSQVYVNVSIYESVIDKNILEIVKDKAFNLNEKKHCLLVWSRLAKIYYRIKYKNQ